MNKCIAVTVILIVSSTFTGCSYWDLKYGKNKPTISQHLNDVNGQEREGIYSWNPDTVGAVTSRIYAQDKDGKLIYVIKDDKAIPISIPRMCVMSAAAIKTRDSENGLTVNIIPPTGSAGVNFVTSSKELQKAIILRAQSEGPTYLDVGFFGICLATMNGHLQKSDNFKLIELLINNSRDITIATEGTKKEALKPDSTSSIQPIQPIQLTP